MCDTSHYKLNPDNNICELIDDKLNEEVDLIENEINNRKETLEDIIKGIKRFIIGLSKKVIILKHFRLYLFLCLKN